MCESGEYLEDREGKPPASSKKQDKIYQRPKGLLSPTLKGWGRGSRMLLKSLTTFSGVLTHLYPFPLLL